MNKKIERGITNEKDKRPFNRLQPVTSNEARWTEGFWAEEFEKCHEVIIPGMLNALLNPENADSISNFAVAAGLEEGRHHGADWSDGDCYKFIQAAAHVYVITNDEELDKMMDKYINEIGLAQEEDGYISTNIQLSQKKRFELSLNLELFNMGHLFTAACVHFAATGKKSFLNIAIKAGNFLYDLYQNKPEYLVNIDRCPANIMGAIHLYRTTGDARYLELACIFLDMRASVKGGSEWFDAPVSISINAKDHDNLYAWYLAQRRSDWTQTRTPLRKEQEAVGHAVEAVFLWCGAADIYSETGEPAIAEALDRMWESMTYRKMYITGGVGALHSGASPNRDYITESFATDYELPNRTAYNETCANIGNAMFNLRMLNITGNAKYADEMERVLYNSMLSSKDIEGRKFFYTNPLGRANKNVSLLSSDTAERWSVFGCYCCPPQLARTIAGLNEWAYGISRDGVWVHLYGGSELNTFIPDKGRIILKQDTGYPWDGNITVTIKAAPKSSFAIMLRIPGWSDGGVIKVNGEQTDIKTEPGTYAVIQRKWKEGDIVHLNLPMRIKLMKAHPLVEETRGRVCAMRGPIVYCLESLDVPAGVKMDEVYLPERPEFSARYDGSLLGGVTVLDGKARRAADADWDRKLYQEASFAQDSLIPITLIPYYAWCNRGVCEMTVWLPVT